jgi:hypothetical protein
VSSIGAAQRRKSEKITFMGASLAGGKMKDTHKLRSPKTAQELLDIYYLDIRCALLETAAALDRMERADNWEKAKKDPRIQKLMKACDLIKESEGNRVEHFLILFSEPVK